MSIFVRRAPTDERGVAMVVVLFVAMALTVLAATASFVTIKEFKATRDDRRAAEALSHADAGIDRFIAYIKSGSITYYDLRQAGCDGFPPLTLPPAVIANGTVSAQLQVFNPSAPTPNARFGASACLARPTNVRQPLFVAITAQGSAPAARRELLQVMRISPVGLPIGHYANFISASGNPTMDGVSMISETSFQGRDKVAFKGTDPYYTLQDFWPGGPFAGRAGTDLVPAAAHALGTLFLGSGGGTKPEFQTSTKNCTANDTRNGGIASQSLWDSDGSAGSGNINPPTCSGQTGYPPSSKFTRDTFDAVGGSKSLSEQDHRALKDSAQTYGLYCHDGAGTADDYCSIRNGPRFGIPQVFQNADIQPVLSVISNFIFYYEFTDPNSSELANSIKWSATNVWPCTSNYSSTIIVRRGGFNLSNGGKLNGAIIVDGAFSYSGGPSVNGTIIAKEIQLSGGANFSLDQCWLDHMPAVFSQAQPVHWSELDR